MGFDPIGWNTESKYSIQSRPWPRRGPHDNETQPNLTATTQTCPPTRPCWQHRKQHADLVARLANEVILVVGVGVGVGVPLGDLGLVARLLQLLLEVHRLVAVHELVRLLVSSALSFFRSGVEQVHLLMMCSLMREAPPLNGWLQSLQLTCGVCDMLLPTTVTVAHT